MIPVNILTSILLLLITFIHASPLELVGHDSSIQKSNIVIRQTTPSDSVTATGPGLLNLTGLVDTFEVLIEGFNEAEGILRNLTEIVATGLSNQITMSVIFRTVFGELSGFTRALEVSIPVIKAGGSDLPNGPLKELFNAVPESLMGLIGAAGNLNGALLALVGGDLSSIPSIFKALIEILNALIAVLVAMSKFFVAAEIVFSAPEEEMDEVLNNTMRLLDGFIGLKGVVEALEILGG